jgi:hypothetical protein
LRIAGRATWVARYRGPDAREHSRTFERKVDAERFLNDKEHRKGRGEWVDPTLGRTPFDKYAASWAATTTHLRPGTRANLEGRLRNHLLSRFAEMPMAAIQPADVRAWVSEMSAKTEPAVKSEVEPKRLVAATVCAAYRTFARIMATAELDGIIARTPCRGIDLPKETAHQEMRSLEASQVGELAALTVERVNVLRGSVDVAEALSEVGGYLPPRTDEDGGTAYRVAPPVPLRDDRRAHRAVPEQRRPRLQLRGGDSAQTAELLPAPLQAGGGAGGTRFRAQVP